ncbi:ATP-dependent RNA helicase DbpA [Agaribacter flavus]|uniref:ATP-dependent RNA helicase DbpA n=1 Tax=Agaribacter flavus TaxID=1902781 RepID=A0ABV7FU98_9ALTE
MQFSQLALSDVLLQAISSLGFHEATATQASALPTVLAGKDVAVEAKTGSGKTLAFGLGILQKQVSKVRANNPSALVLCPTRELAEQVAEQIRLLAKFIPNYKVLSLFGGVAMGPQLSSLKHPPDTVVGTPGRIIDIIGKKALSLSAIHTLVLDEADRMLDMGFAEQMDHLLALLNKNAEKPQTLLFSATFGGRIQSLSAQYQNKAKIIKVEDESENPRIVQYAWQLLPGKRDYAVAALLTEQQPKSAIVFCNKKVDVKNLADSLRQMGFSIVELHGDLEQEQRNQAIRAFSSDCANVLVASDVAARGLDIPSVDLVINADISPDVDTHTHRIGRTGRAGNKGLAMTLIEVHQLAHLEKIAAFLEQTIPVKNMQALRFHANRIVPAKYEAIEINAGKKAKINKGDILGALTKQAEISGDDIGKIQVAAQRSFIAIKSRSVKRAMSLFREHKVKGKRVRARKF